MAFFFGSITKSRIQNPIKSLWWSFFAKIVNNFQLGNKLYYFTYFYIILYNFDCPAFVDIKQTALQCRNIVNIIRETFIFYAFFLMFFSYFFAGLCFAMIILDGLFFIWETKKVVAGCVRQVVILYSNDCSRICLGRLSIGCLRRVVVLQWWSFEQV